MARIIASIDTESRIFADLADLDRDSSAWLALVTELFLCSALAAPEVVS